MKDNSSTEMEAMMGFSGFGKHYSKTSIHFHFPMQERNTTDFDLNWALCDTTACKRFSFINK